MIKVTKDENICSIEIKASTDILYDELSALLTCIEDDESVANVLLKLYMTEVI